MQSGLLVFTDFVGIVAFALAGILAAENRRVLIRRFREKTLHTAFVWSDAIGLGFFAAGGTSVSLTAGLPYLPAVLMGVCTGVFGGLLRDAFLNRLPLVMSDKQPYASAAFVGSWLYILLHELGVSEFFALFGSTLFIVGVRMICWYKNWEVIHYDFFRTHRETHHTSNQPPLSA